MVCFFDASNVIDQTVRRRPGRTRDQIWARLVTLQANGNRTRILRGRLGVATAVGDVAGWRRQSKRAKCVFGRCPVPTFNPRKMRGLGLMTWRSTGRFAA